eukprot:gene2469-3178_t
MKYFFLQLFGLLIKNFKIYSKEYRYLLISLVFPFFITLQLAGSGYLFGLIDQIPPQYESLSTLNHAQKTSEIVFYSNPNIKPDNMESVLRHMVPFVGTLMKFKKFDSTSKIDEYLSSSTTDKVFAGLIFENLDFQRKLFNYTIMYNSTDINTLPKMNNILTNSIQGILNKTNPISKYPFAKFIRKSSEKSILFSSSGPYFLSLSVTFLISVFAQMIVEEKETKIKDQIILSGVNIFTYWLSRFIIDFTLYCLIVSFQIIILIFIGQIPTFIDNSFFIIFSLYFFYGTTLTSRKDVSQWLGAIIALSLSAIFIIVNFIANNNIPNWVNVLGSFVPIYSLFYGISTLSKAIINDNPITLSSLFTFKNENLNIFVLLLILIFETIFFVFCIILFEFVNQYKKRIHLKNFENDEIEIEDEDVFKEIEKTKISNDMLRILNVSKTYQQNYFSCLKKKEKKVLKNVYLSIQKGECFGLLGPNGAGKSTLISIISGILGTNGGNVFLNNFDVLKNPNKVYNHLGVCAQEDRLWEKLTGKEHVQIYTYIRGLTYNDSSLKILERFNLTEEVNKKVSDYSQGNKRRLSVALSFIGSPQIVLLDEPSSGMDPSMRKTLWNEITKLREDRVILLLTHSMEEADALCSRLGVLVNGELKCIGSSQHLKNKFGGGYIFSLIGKDENLDIIENWIKENFKNVKIINKIVKQH